MASVNVNQSNVSLDNPMFNDMLNNLQANVLKFHGRSFAHHLFFKFVPAEMENLRKWLIYFSSKRVTNAYTQLYDAGLKKANPNYNGGSVYTLSLSNYGCSKLNVKSSIRQDITFENGMRGSEFFIKDNPANWDPGFDQYIDMLIIVADDDDKTAAAHAQSVINQVSHFATLVLNQRGNVLKMEGTNVGIEHFGYADGISQPMYLAKEIKEQQNGAVWDDATNLDMVLVEEQDGMDNCFGSYFVFRKLEQNVLDFKNVAGDNGQAAPGKILIKVNGVNTSVKDESGALNPDLGGAMIVGRFENSTPVVKNGGKALHPNPHSTKLDNNFDYSDDLGGLKCPYFSHVRLVNPRKGNPAQDADEIRSHRITRRGIPFDDNHPKRIPDDKILAITETMLDDISKQYKTKLGLLFMCYQSDIKTHFEELQGQWANTGIIDPAKISIGQDCLITQSAPTAESKCSIPQQWNKPLQSDKFNFSGYVTMRGGEYFYTPSIPFLKNL